MTNITLSVLEPVYSAKVIELASKVAGTIDMLKESERINTGAKMVKFFRTYKDTNSILDYIEKLQLTQKIIDLGNLKLN